MIFASLLGLLPFILLPITNNAQPPSTCSGQNNQFPQPPNGECVSGWSRGNTYKYPDDFGNIRNEVTIYACPDSGKRIIKSNGIPDHDVVQGNPNSPCEKKWGVSMPLNPTIATSKSEPPVRGIIAMCINGVPAYGPQEAGSSNAVEPPAGSFIQDAQFWYGHAAMNNDWHIHNPHLGEVDPSSSDLLAYALDGFPIYGPLSDTSLLDECNGRTVNGGYQYHVRDVNQIDADLDYCNGSSPATNWNYIIGCYSGTLENTIVTNSDNLQIPSDCVVEGTTTLAPQSSPSEPTPTPPTPTPPVATPPVATPTNPTPTGSDSIPELCTDQNKGDCDCHSGDDRKTFVFEPGNYKRCIHTYIPDSPPSPLPVLISVSAYGQGSLGFADKDKASYYGYAVFGIGSTGPFDGAGNFGLEFPANGVVNHLNPTPCEETDSRDYLYIKGVLDFIANDDSLDASKVYFEGFSQNSMFAVYASVCFADRVAGVWQGGSGLAKTYHKPLVPGLQGQCSASIYSSLGNDCCDDNFCTDCTWWPLYPRTCENKLVDCIAAYTNDNIACGSDWYMYEAMVAEGNDARMLSFSPASGINGGHANPKNKHSWVVGCLGIVDSCSELCETSFLNCATSISEAEFVRCETELKNGNLANCDIGCAPTLKMLQKSETPLINLSEGSFGTQNGLEVATNPQMPVCDNNFGSFNDVGFDNRCRPPSGEGPAEGEVESCGTAPTPTIFTPTAPTPTAPTPTGPTPTAPTPTAPTPTAPTPTAPTPTAPTPTVPSPTPPTSSTCTDSTLRFKLMWQGKRRTRDCTWVANRLTYNRCQVDGVSAHCPNACESCSDCVDSTVRFKFVWNNKTIHRDCEWVARKATYNRCQVGGISDSCRSACQTC